MSGRKGIINAHLSFKNGNQECLVFYMKENVFEQQASTGCSAVAKRILLPSFLVSNSKKVGLGGGVFVLVF